MLLVMVSHNYKIVNIILLNGHYASLSFIVICFASFIVATRYRLCATTNIARSANISRRRNIARRANYTRSVNDAQRANDIRSINVGRRPNDVRSTKKGDPL